MIAFLKKIFREQKGQVLILAVFVIIMSIAFVGLIIDVGLINYQKQKLQDSVDLAVLAASQELPNGPIVSTAIQFADKNGISSNELLAIYAMGNIEISANNAKIQGVLYAPNGQIRINGTDNQFYGGLIANEIVTVSSDIVVNASYDFRTPQAFTVEKTIFKLVE